MNRQKIFLFNCIILILLINILPEVGLCAIAPMCREVENRGETCEIEKNKYNKENYRPIDFFQDIEVPVLNHSIHHFNSFIIVFKSNCINSYLYFLSNLFNHSPPIF